MANVCSQLDQVWVAHDADGAFLLRQKESGSTRRELGQTLDIIQRPNQTTTAYESKSSARQSSDLRILSIGQASADFPSDWLARTDHWIEGVKNTLRDLRNTACTGRYIRTRRKFGSQRNQIRSPSLVLKDGGTR